MMRASLGGAGAPARPIGRAIKGKSRTLVLLIAGVLIAAACGRDTQSPESVERPKLIVGIAGADAAYLQVYVAKINGYFDDAEVDVEIKNFGANVIAGMVSVQLDLAILGSNAAMAPVNEGAETSIIYNNVGGGLAGFVYGGPEVQDISECTRMGTTQVGSSTYSWAVLEKELLNGDWDIVPGEIATTIASFQSGAISCITSTPQCCLALVADDKARELLNPTDPETLPADVTLSDFDFVDGGVYGMKDNLQQKRDAVVRFIEAYQRALAMIRSETPAELAAILMEHDDWLPFNQDDLEEAIGVNKPFHAPHDGYIPSDVWPRSLEYYISGGSTFINPNDEEWSYQNRVDTSYFEEAVGEPNS